MLVCEYNCLIGDNMSGHFPFCNYVLVFEHVDTGRGRPVSVRSQPRRVISRAKRDQSSFTAWGAFLTAHAALEPILNRELEAPCGLRDDEAAAVEAVLARIAAAARQDDSLASQAASTGT